MVYVCVYSTMKEMSVTLIWPSHTTRTQWARLLLTSWCLEAGQYQSPMTTSMSVCLSVSLFISLCLVLSLYLQPNVLYAIPLLVQPFTCTDSSWCAFRFLAPSVWQLLPQTVLISDSVFLKSRLKTFLFTQAFTEHWSDLPPAPPKLRPYGAIEIRLLLCPAPIGRRH